jgi:hypothetical protein
MADRTKYICVGGGNLYIDGVMVGLIFGDVVLTREETDYVCDGTLQHPKQVIGVIPVGAGHTLRFNCEEGSMGLIQKAWNLGAITSSPPEQKIGLGLLAAKVVRSISFYGMAPEGQSRRFDLPKCVAVNPGELKVAGQEPTRPPMTFTVLKDTDKANTVAWGTITDNLPGTV